MRSQRNAYSEVAAGEGAAGSKGRLPVAGIIKRVAASRIAKPSSILLDKREELRK
jgi:hypothetical protein